MDFYLGEGKWTSGIHFKSRANGFNPHKLLNLEMEPPQFNIRHVEAYRQDLCDQADLLLVNEIPSQLRKVEEILAGVRLKSG